MSQPLMDSKGRPIFGTGKPFIRPKEGWPASHCPYYDPKTDKRQCRPYTIGVNPKGMIWRCGNHDSTFVALPRENIAEDT